MLMPDFILRRRLKCDKFTSGAGTAYLSGAPEFTLGF
jgi:hypothetical protein